MKPSEPAVPPAADAAAPEALRQPPPKAVDDSLSGLFRRLLDDLIMLVRSELRLAGGEVRSRIEESATSLAAIGLGAMLISVAMLCLLGAGVAFLAQYVGVTSAALIVAAGALAVAGGLIYWGISNLRSQQLAPSRAVANLKRNVELLEGD